MTREDAPIFIRHLAADRRGEFVAESDGHQIGSLLYSRRAHSAITIERVFVVPEARGGSVARTLVEAAVALARYENASIIPLCRYARVLLRRSGISQPSVPRSG